MSFIHGKGTRLLLNAAEVSTYFDNTQTANKLAADETTTFTNSDKTFIVGLGEGTASLTGLFDGAALAIDAQIESIITALTSSVLTIARAGLGLGARVHLLSGEITDYEVTAPVAGVVKTKLDLEADGGINGGVVLAGQVAVTATGSQTSVDNAALTSNGGVSHLHVTANTLTGSATFKVQHSVDGSTWVDLVTHTVVPTVTTTAERIIVAPGTTINRYLRANYTLAGSGSVTATIAFARR